MGEGAKIFNIDGYRSAKKKEESKKTDKDDKNKEVSARIRIQKIEESLEETSESVKEKLELKGQDALVDTIKVLKSAGFSLQEVMESVKNMAFIEDLKREGKNNEEIQRLTVEIFDSIK